MPDFAAIEPIYMKLDLMGALDVALIPVIITFLFVNIFDTAGTLMGVAQRANLQDENGKIEGLSKSLKADSISSVLGTAFGCPPVTSYVESAAVYLLVAVRSDGGCYRSDVPVGSVLAATSADAAWLCCGWRTDLCRHADDGFTGCN